MQAIAKFHGASIVRSAQPVHGCLSDVAYNAKGVFDQLDPATDALRVVRYHSLIVDSTSVDKSKLTITAWSVPGEPSSGEPDDEVVMGIESTLLPHWGVQFHPESVATFLGRRIMESFYNHVLLQKHGEGKKAPDDLMTALSNIQLAPPKSGPPRPSDFSSTASNDIVSAKQKYRVRWRRYAGVANRLDAADIFWGFIAKLQHPEGRDCFWLDSASTEAGRARFSYLGARGGSSWRKITYNLKESAKLDIYNNKLERVNHEHCTACGSETPPAESRSSIFDVLKRWLSNCECESGDTSLPFDFCGGFVGFFGYELKAECGGDHVHASPHHDAAFFFTDQFVTLDHDTGELYAVALVPITDTDDTDSANSEMHAWFNRVDAFCNRSYRTGGPSDGYVDGESKQSSREEKDRYTAPGFTLRRSRDQYEHDVKVAKERIAAGETYEVCLTTMLHTVRTSLNAHALYKAMRDRVPAPHGALLDFNNGLQICSSSPERFLRLDRNGVLEAKPIKGTRKRASPLGCDEDTAIANELAHCTKDKAENLMIVDLLRNDLGRVSEVGSVHVPDGKLFAIESYSAVHQMVTTVRSQKLAGATAVDCIRAAFPGGSMTGAPKSRTMRLIDELEVGYRGPYSGSIGFLSINGTFDLSIVIRTAVVAEEQVDIGAGGAVVALSTPSEEYDEMRLKAQALERAFHEATAGA